MRPTLSWSDLPGRRVGLYGLGREGVAALRACLALGIVPVLVDDARITLREAGFPAFRVLETARGGREALGGCDVVVASPGISRYGAAITGLREQGVVVTGALAMWLAEADPARVIAVTGTKGKSTTTAIAAHLLAGLGVKAAVGGNIGVPPFDPLVTATGTPDVWVVEVSSYQAADVARSPAVVGVTSLHPDHLPWHAGDVERYYADKLSLCSGSRTTVANGDSPLLRERAALLGRAVEWVGELDDPGATWMEALGLPGRHNRRNALIARRLLAAAGFSASDDELASAAAGFEGLESRLQTVAAIDGVDFVDDGLSTNVLPTLAAVEAYPDRRVALVVGGQDRGIDYTPLAEGLRDRVEDLLLIGVPDNGDRILDDVRRAGPGPAVTLAADPGLEAAVARAFAWARPGGVVLLSPAAPSFGRFVDYRHRGAAFRAAVEGLA